MFMGEFNHSLDAKGRTFVPAKMRDELGESFVVTQGLDKCLTGYTISEWKKVEEKLSHLDSSKKNVRMFIRFMTAKATVCDVDKQGRILIPANLREYAGLEKEIVFIGATNKIEIWDKSKWDENCEEYDNMEELVESMEGFDFSL